MASSDRRASIVFSDEERPEPNDFDDGRTPLDKTIDKIGMGNYQWSLLGLCGFGWMADNMWLEAIAIVLPRVQDHYSVSNNHIGWLSTSTFAGMMIGAVGWGTCSDQMGRSTAFNATLFLTTIFGLLACLAPSFSSLCFSLFFLGSAVGGSMPTDGTLFLENIPRKKHYLLTALSVFFSVGAVLSAVVGIIIIPRYSCPENIQITAPPCDVATQNMGWRYLFGMLTAFTAVMFLSRIFLFRLYESPRYLVHVGRPIDAVCALREITNYNGVPLTLTLKDVQDTLVHSPPTDLNPSCPPTIRRSPIPSPPSDYHATETLPEAPLAHGSYPYDTPRSEPTELLLGDSTSEDKDAPPPSPRPRPGATSFHGRRRSSSYLSVYDKESRWSKLPQWLSKPTLAWWEKVEALLTPEWRRTTLLMWACWGLMSFAYTMFNVYLPKLLENRTGKGSEPGGNREEVMWDVVIYTVAGCPGALLGAWMIETRLGRRKSLALSTFVTGLCCVAFVRVTTQHGIVLSSMGISLASTTMWAVLYGMTPEIFRPEVRGTASGNAAALNRIGGMIAPLLGGSLMAIDHDGSIPVYTSGFIFVVAACCALALPFESTAELEMAGKAECISTPEPEVEESTALR